jgi:hypothetical protein
MRIITSLVGAAIVSAALTGCYVYVPVETSTAPVGETVAFDISDQGRVQLGERLGPGVLRIEGRVVGTDASDILLNVSRVGYLGGEASQWSGETVRFDRGFIARTHERRLSKGRTWTAVGVTTAIVVGFLATRGLAGFGSDDDEGPEDPPPQSIIIRFR